MTTSRPVEASRETQASLAAIDGAPVGQDVQVAGAPRPVLHPVLELRLVAGALRAVVLVLAARVLLAQLAGAARELREAQQAVVHLVRDGQEARVVHVRVRGVHGIQVANREDLLLSGRHL
eukprot:CAMPEP_0115098676 /NCGR_PEP_ID=MMETSP0227-20121206/31321_1 /TAXON_ID=89957 /ORGANISM="Polarella glacialis, Strain CCMP 1383" /LENGTH=120 /DNA_ID=CAMNT_0002493367 /DNA_START=49 /DNA_END=411 /DNA_ORIENTATION=-